MIKVVAIVGPTATGKTALAVSLCRKFNGEIISVDSRQVYQEIDIGTAKTFQKSEIGHRRFPKRRWGSDVKIHLYDVLKPSQLLTAYDFARLSWEKIEGIIRRGRIPFLVGGTGFYLNVILGKVQLSGTGTDPKLRQELEKLSLLSLEQLLAKVNPERLKTIDRHNRYRLIRALEIALSQTQNPAASQVKEVKNIKYLSIGLTSANQVLYRIADRRVAAMIKAGLVAEVRELVRRYGWEAPGLKALGYREFKPYFEGRASLPEVVEKLKFNTHAYIRRQKTYFKANSEIEWFDISQAKFEKKVEAEVQSFLTR